VDFEFRRVNGETLNWRNGARSPIALPGLKQMAVAYPQAFTTIEGAQSALNGYPAINPFPRYHSQDPAHAAPSVRRRVPCSAPMAGHTGYANLVSEVSRSFRAKNC